MKRIIGFDSWTRGSHHFARLVQAFRKRGFELLLIHIGSWGHDKDRAEEEILGDLLVRDIRYYRGMSFKDILLRENPAAVIYLSTRAFAHQSFNRYAHSLGIPTCHLYHGLVNVQAVEAGDLAYKMNWVSQSRIIFDRFLKNATILLPSYAKSLVCTKAGLKHWLWFFKEIMHKATATVYDQAPPDCTTTTGCVYTQADVRHMVRVYGVPQEMVQVVGNPDLAAFQLKENHLGCRINEQQVRKNEIIYIDTALIEAGVVFGGRDDFMKHLLDTHERLREHGYSLILKLHPGHFRTGVADDARKHGLEICEKEDFVDRLNKASAVIVESSTAAMIPALMGMPLLLANYGKLQGQAYGKVLTTYPKARHLKDLKQVQNILSEIETSTQAQEVWDWIRENSGPLPAEDMPDRVAEAVMQVIRN